MRPPFFKDWRFYSILTFFLIQCAFSVWGGFWFDTERGIIIAILWLAVSLFAWNRQIFTKKIKIIAASMFLSPLLFVIIGFSSQDNHDIDFILSLCINYYPVLYPIFNFLYGKLRHTHFTIFESFLLGIICIPIIFFIFLIYICIFYEHT